MTQHSEWRPVTLSALLAACAITIMPAMAATDSPPPGMLPAERTSGNVIYLSGGIGHDEALALRRDEANYPLALEFVRNGESGAEFLANVNVTIKDRQGNVLLDTESDGPLFLAKLPDGNYKVTAAAEAGAPKERDIVVTGRKHEHVVFVW